MSQYLSIKSNEQPVIVARSRVKSASQDESDSVASLPESDGRQDSGLPAVSVDETEDFEGTEEVGEDSTWLLRLIWRKKMMS